MSERETTASLKDILEAIDRIIGEAVRNIPADMRRQHKEIQWSLIAGTRDKLIHHYFGVNWEIVW